MLVYSTGMHPHGIPVHFFFQAAYTHTHTHTHTSSNKSTFPWLTQKKQVYMPIQAGQVGGKNRGNMMGLEKL